jgi:hypothetical protein
MHRMKSISLNKKLETHFESIVEIELRKFSDINPTKFK